MHLAATTIIRPSLEQALVCSAFIALDADIALEWPMPTVKRFGRCRIAMYFNDHPPPHFHIITNAEERVVLIIETLEVLAGSADVRDISEALQWAEGNRERLRQLWREYSE